MVKWKNSCLLVCVKIILVTDELNCYRSICTGWKRNKHIWKTNILLIAGKSSMILKILSNRKYCIFLIGATFNFNIFKLILKSALLPCKKCSCWRTKSSKYYIIKISSQVTQMFLVKWQFVLYLIKILHLLLQTLINQWSNRLYSYNHYKYKND